MTRLLPFLILGSLCGAKTACAESKGLPGLQIDSSVLEELEGEAKRVNTEVKRQQEARKHAEPLRQANAAEMKSPFGRMRDLFRRATAISPGDFRADVAFAGECVSKSAPQVVQASLANVYVQWDPTRGSQVYLALKASPAPKDGEELRRLHQLARKEKDEFTPLQFGSKSTALADLVSAMSPNSAFFTQGIGRGSASHPKHGGPVQAHLFNVRMDRDADEKPFLIVERLCPQPQGCKLSGTTIMDYLNYVESFGYCHYSRMQFLPGEH